MKLAQAIETAVDKIISGEPTALLKDGAPISDAWCLFGVCEAITADEVFSDTWNLVALPSGFSAERQLESAREWRAERLAEETERPTIMTTAFEMLEEEGISVPAGASEGLRGEE